MARHAVAVAFTVLLHALLGLVSAMPGPGAPSRSGGPRLQCPHCFRDFKTHACFRQHQAAMAHDEGKTGCGRGVLQPMSSGWSGGGARAAGTVADLSGQLEAGRLPGLTDSDSDSSGRGGHGRRIMDQDGRGQGHPVAADSEEDSVPDVPDSPAGDGGAAPVHTCTYLHIPIIHEHTCTYS